MKKNLLYTLLFLMLFFSLSPKGAHAKSVCKLVKPIDISHLSTNIGQRKISFFAKDLDSSVCYRLKKETFTLSHTVQHTPWSTFKIPNLIIALETGVAPSLDYALPWSPTKRPKADYWPKDWAQTQTLKSAFKRSAAWYFQDLALVIGSPRYKKWLTSFNYGNLNVKKGDDAFWLNHTLKISPLEQVHFLSNLLIGELPVSNATLKSLNQVAFLEALNSANMLYGKTGSGPLKLNNFNGPFEGWLVGYVTRKNKSPLVYALYTEGANYAEISKFRKQISKTLLPMLMNTRNNRVGT